MSQRCAIPLRMSQPHQQNRNTPAPRILTPERRAYLAENYEITEPQVDVIRNAICVGATDEELEFFLATCKRLKLDPFARQIWFVKRKQKVIDDFGNEDWLLVGKPETSIDGFRTIAERTGQYGGQDPIQWCGPDGKWLDVWLKNTPPAAARAAVYRVGIAAPFVAVSVFAEHAPYYRRGQDLVLSPMWQKMPAGQIAKCAEALAFRRGFPRDLSGIDTDTEQQHVEADAANANVAKAPPLPVASSTPALPSPAAKPAIDVTSRTDMRPTDTREAVPAKPAPTVEVSKSFTKQADDAGAPVETSNDPDLENRVKDLLDDIALAPTLDDMRTISNRTPPDSPEHARTKAAFVARWKVLAHAERKKK